MHQVTRPSTSQQSRGRGTTTLGSPTLVGEEEMEEETSPSLRTRWQVVKGLANSEVEEMTWEEQETWWEEMVWEEVLETCSLVLVGEKQAQLTSWLQLRVIPAEAIIFNEP